MPQKQPHRTKLNGRVRIKDEVTHMYEHARVYNEGIVRKQDHDEFGYPRIYVEWDKDHWAYSGEKDGVTLEAHFDPVEENDMADKNEDLAAALSEFLRGWQDGRTQDEEPPKDDPRPTGEPDYHDTLKNAIEDAANGEAFLIFVATKESFGDAALTVPHAYANYKSDEAAAALLDAAAADHVTQSLIRMVQEVKRNGSSGS